MPGAIEAGSCVFSSPMFLTTQEDITFSSKVQREQMHSNLYLSTEAFSAIEHIGKLAMFCSSKSLALNAGCLEFEQLNIALLSFLFVCSFVFASESKTFKTWASTKCFPHRNTGAYQYYQVTYTQTIKPALSEILQNYCTGTDSLQGAFGAYQVLSGAAVWAISCTDVQRLGLTHAMSLVFFGRIH